MNRSSYFTEDYRNVFIDLHTHTLSKSDDSVMTVDDLVEAAKRAGLDGVCLTEHDRFWQEDEVASLSRRHGILVLGGCELTTEEGHLLVFGLKEYEFGMHSARFVKKLVDRNGGTMMVAHPYRRVLKVDDFAVSVSEAVKNPVFGFVDAVEGCNGRGTEMENEFARQLGDKLSLRLVGGSDAHRLEDVGACATEFEQDINTLDDLIRSIHEGCFRPVKLK